MIKIEDSSSNSTDLLCGFIQPNSIASQLLFALLPDIYLIKKKMTSVTKYTLYLSY